MKRRSTVITRQPQGDRLSAPPSGREPRAPASTLDEAFSRTARRHPRRIAVQDGWNQLTYARTEQQAVRLAAALVRGGVQLGEPLVVHCGDHRQALIAQLGVLKAGAVCVPHTGLAGGLADTVRATGARAVLCSRSTYDRTVRDVPSLALDDPLTWRKIAAAPTEPALPRSVPEGGAHLFLDGSRRELLVEHRAWLCSAADRSRRVGAPTATVAIGQEPMSRVALAAMWWAFGSGATLHTAPWQHDPRWPLSGARDSVAVLPSDAYDPRSGSTRDQDGPRAVVLIGAPCSRDLAARHFEARPRTRLWSEFAPTDGSLPWTAREIHARDTARPYEPGAGSPVPPIRLRITGPHGESLPRGAVGEIVGTGPSCLPEDVQDSGWRGRWASDHTLDITGRPPPHLSAPYPSPARTVPSDGIPPTKAV
ncbi:AMP-binding protein [Streptomyces sp. NPDC058861]|uniref:AMP-binding protein n=1 Tax=Streptomyces sp. NPDC058861 TaxID=3346653 RepID=UPI003691C0CA